MIVANPFVALFERPVATLTAAAYALVLLSALVATTYAGTRNAVYLADRFQNGWRYLAPLWYTVRIIATLLVIAVDLLLVAGIVHVLS